MPYFLYIVRCADNSLYCGITNDLHRRIAEHNSNSAKSAKYTRSRGPVNLVYQEIFSTKQEAMKREYLIKQFKKKDKENLVEVLNQKI